MTAPGEDVPDTTAYLSVLTTAAAGVDDRAATLRYLKRLGEKVPDDARVQEKLGIALLAAGETEEAVATLNRALQLDPRAEKAYARLFGIYLQRANFAEGLELTKQVQEAFPDRSVGHTLEGIVLIVTGDRAGAEAALRRALEKQSSDPDAVRNLVPLLLAEERPDDAKRVLAAALAQQPPHPNPPRT